MTTVRAFWDTSVLVPLCIAQPPHTQVSRALSLRYSACVWWGSPVEIISALTRLRRSAGLSEQRYYAAKLELPRLLSEWQVVAPSVPVRDQAQNILEAYPLRAADAFQLAAALAWCEGVAKGQVFLTADRRLGEAAAQAGFTLEPGLI